MHYPPSLLDATGIVVTNLCCLIMAAVFLQEEVSTHCTAGDLWGVVDGYVVDLTGFVDKHPGGSDKILSITTQKGFSFSSGPNAHFG